MPEARLAQLSRGVNVMRWFHEWGRRPPFAEYLSDADLAAIHGLGFRFVRLAVDPQYLHRPGYPGVLDTGIVAELDSAIDRLLAHDLAVVVTPFPHELPLLEDSAQVAGFARFWEALAANLGTRDPERVFLEVVNEPVFKRRPEAWVAAQRMLLAAMRRGAPRNTLIATGPFWSSIDGLVRLSPLDDPNVLYTFHFYEPPTFTHQGLAWAWRGKLHDLPYPADSSRCAAATTRLKDPGALAMARRYCDAHWDRRVIEASLDRAKQWAGDHRVPIFAGEFGVACTAPEQGRLAWLGDVRAGLEARGIGWALWGWDDQCFGLNAHRTADGRLVLDSGILSALGLGGQRTSVRAPPM